MLILFTALSILTLHWYSRTHQDTKFRAFAQAFCLDEVQSNPEQYREQVLAMQELIRAAVEKGVTVEAQEQRNKQAMRNMLSTKRKEIRKVQVSSSAASKYYKAMSQINEIDPQLMDRKK